MALQNPLKKIQSSQILKREGFDQIEIQDQGRQRLNQNNYHSNEDLNEAYMKSKGSYSTKKPPVGNAR